MLKKYLYIFLISMVPLIELRGAIPVSQGFQLPLLQSYIVCVIGNMLPVPVIYLLQERFLSGERIRNILESSLLSVLKKDTRVERSLRRRLEEVFCSIITFCWNSASGNRCMDGNTCSKFSRYGI